MAFVLLRYRLTLGIVLAAMAATACFLSFGLPRTRTPNERRVDLARVHYYSPALVRRTFATHGIHLRYGYAVFGVIHVLSTNRTSDELSVEVGSRKGQVSWGPKPAHEYDQPFGNLLVHYSGTNPNTLAAVKAAVAALR